MSRFFLNCNDGIPPSRVKALAEKWGPSILIGVDPGLGDRPDEWVMDTIKAVKHHRCRLHVYLVGPGMLEWSPEEAAQIKSHAKSVGIDITKKNWHEKWLDKGWLLKFVDQAVYYAKEHGAYSVEIDNLDQIVDQDPKETIGLYEEILDLLKDQELDLKIMIKNLDERQLFDLKKAIKDGRLPREMFAEWAMFEAGSGRPNMQIDICKELGIRAVTPISGITDTYNYGVTHNGVPFD